MHLLTLSDLPLFVALKQKFGDLFVSDFELTSSWRGCANEFACFRFSFDLIMNHKFAWAIV